MSQGLPGLKAKDTVCIDFYDFSIAWTARKAPPILLNSTHEDASWERNKYKITMCDKNNYD